MDFNQQYSWLISIKNMNNLFWPTIFKLKDRIRFGREKCNMVLGRCELGAGALLGPRAEQSSARSDVLMHQRCTKN